jgi:hypothetical protein
VGRPGRLEHGRNLCCVVPGRNPSRQAAAEGRFEFWHTVLGTGVGETAGYTLTALFTVLVVRGLHRSLIPSWLAVIGLVAAAFIVTGVLVPLVHAASLTNFAGYILWCGWLLGVAVTLFRFNTTGATVGARSSRSYCGCCSVRPAHSHVGSVERTAQAVEDQL